MTQISSPANVATVDLKTYLKKSKTTQAEIARRMRVTAGLVNHWVHGNCRVGAERVLALEALTGGEVSRHDIRPDLYPRERAA